MRQTDAEQIFATINNEWSYVFSLQNGPTKDELQKTRGRGKKLVAQNVHNLPFEKSLIRFNS